MKKWKRIVVLPVDIMMSSECDPDARGWPASFTISSLMTI